MVSPGPRWFHARTNQFVCLGASDTLGEQWPSGGCVSPESLYGTSNLERGAIKINVCPPVSAVI